MITTKGTYFDGNSSIPQNIELTFDDGNTSLLFELADHKSVVWLLESIEIEETGNSLEIRLKNNKISFIKIQDSEFKSHLIQNLKSKGHIGWYYKLMHFNLKTYIGFAIFFLGLIACGYIFVIPWIAEKAVQIIPEKYDKELASKFLIPYLEDNDVDSVKTSALNQFASELKLENVQPLHFTVIISSTVNAFALPNGNIVVYTGLIKLMKNYDEMAGLIGHEVIHVNRRHSMKMLCRNLSGYIFISVMLSDVNGLMTVIADNARNLESLSYSRQFEKEADEQGTELMIKNNINPKGMTQLFMRLKTEEKVQIPAFISTHPMTNDRIENINRLIKKKSFRTSKNERLEKLFIDLKD